MMNARTLFNPACVIPAAGLLVLATVFANVHPALAQTDDACPPPSDVTLPPAPQVTAQQVEDGSATPITYRLASSGPVKLVIYNTYAHWCVRLMPPSPARSGGMRATRVVFCCRQVSISPGWAIQAAHRRSGYCTSGNTRIIKKQVPGEPVFPKGEPS